MRAVILAVSLAATAATTAASPAPPAAPVLGGTDVPAGKWRDAVALLYPAPGGEVAECTGVLIAPTIVLTAAHCIYDPDFGFAPPSRAWIGTNSLDHPELGEDLVVAEAQYHMGAYDLGVVRLATPSAIPPRALATGWVRADIVDGARVVFTGYGAIDRDGKVYVDELREAETTVTDAGCARSSGCEPAARPDGELGAGGMGIDTCPGDSGGPIYLLTPYGEFLTGITSRGYDNSTFECTDGGIYTRPDKDELVAWIEEHAGIALPAGRGPRAEPLVVAMGESGTVTLDADDPRTDATHAWELVGAPLHGTAAVDDAGVVTYTAADNALGPDVVVVRATDRQDPTRSARGRIEVEVIEGAGCCGATRGGGGLWPALVVVATLCARRRRRLAA